MRTVKGENMTHMPKPKTCITSCKHEWSGTWNTQADKYGCGPYKYTKEKRTEPKRKGKKRQPPMKDIEPLRSRKPSDDYITDINQPITLTDEAIEAQIEKAKQQLRKLEVMEDLKQKLKQESEPEPKPEPEPEPKEPDKSRMELLLEIVEEDTAE